ncbi:hypothetical protein [Polaromonas sp. A23]|uniref:hypothetical protein n=1 Tax=Polaromonas sp. A23 TaxID=1944133 RepID=UPI0011155CE9|nr:hypothetical protein [Polaromonas sp. A23]
MMDVQLYQRIAGIFRRGLRAFPPSLSSIIKRLAIAAFAFKRHFSWSCCFRSPFTTLFRGVILGPSQKIPQDGANSLFAAQVFVIAFSLEESTFHSFLQKR